MKVVGWIVGLVVLVIAGVVAYVAMNSGSLVKTAIEELGPDYLGVDVAVSEVNLALLEGSAQVKGLVIGNPSGFSGPHLMKLDEIKVVLDPDQISESLVVIKEVLIDGAEIAAIAQGQRTNFQQLMDNLESAGGSSASAEETADSAASEMKFIIDRFTFTNAAASLDSDLLGNLQLNMPDIRLSDVGRKSNGATASEIAKQILKPISEALSSEVVKQGLDLDGIQKDAEEKVRKEIDGGLRSLTDRFKKSSD